MSIRILPESEIVKKSGALYTPPLLFASPKNLYQRRAKRLRDLAQDNPFADYLNFAALIVEAQAKVLAQMPLPEDMRLKADSPSHMPLSVHNWQRDPIWREYLHALLAELKPQVNLQAAAAIEALEKSANTSLENLADQLLQQEYAQVGTDKAVFIWAALSLYWLQLTQQIPHNAKAESGENLHLCPVCGCAPVASIVQIGASQGLRYLHCALCETEWNVVRAKCSNCDQANGLNYWSIDNASAAVKAESCEDCHSYLKILYQEKDPYVEAVADDLAAIYLDIEMEEKGLARSGLNPFMFPAENI
ncbi:Tat proofreading chaperone FdhE [Mesocricetibacter intestinalis]|uniref:Protein FdhE homolog n=1 Tax=Mesocricetibacter intestinalis TaxID=1521930 RepID=A0A4R6VBC4_9PAST|nr:formate dehydrogenase accessory protein FdhE [Mesocricetibacter intestinalis]TDQ57358.1 Tat proofreading chaperone FdhE [Mesocricetibacter intestinalis]